MKRLRARAKVELGGPPPADPALDPREAAWHHRAEMGEPRPSAEREALDLLIEAVARGMLDLRTLANATAIVARRAAQPGERATRDELLRLALSPEKLGQVQRLALVLPTRDPAALDAVAYTLTLAGSAACTEALADEGRDRPTDEPRYAIGTELGRGGAGVVVGARDADIGRTVAMKTLRAGKRSERREVKRFLDEARIAGQLEHPSVVPVYDLGALPDGQPFYTMRIVERRTLREVIGGLADEAVDRTRHEWPLSRLCHVMVQVSRALAYAHERGVVHRDVKPENILLGRFGEVYVADWGVAKVSGSAEVDTGPGRSRDENPTTLALTHEGSMMGTIGYMSPEQVRGEPLDGRSDLFGLGVVLYELLTQGKARPFDSSNTFHTLMATTEKTPKRPRELAPGCPIVLDELCMRLLSKARDDRPPTGDAVADEIESYLEGDKERARRAEEALRVVLEAREHVARHEALYADRERYLAEARALLRDCKPHDSVDGKRAGWAKEELARGVEIEQADELARALHCYSRALGLAPDAKEVRGGLADFYWMRAQRAVREHDRAAQTYHEALVREYDAHEGRYTVRLSADARLSVRSSPSGAEVIAYRYVERDRVLVAEEPRSIGTTPVAEVVLPPGSFLLVLKRAGYRDTRVPVVCRRGEHHTLDVNLYTDAEIGDEFVYVPGGPAIFGGDAEAFDPLPRREIVVPDFAIARHAVTFAEYLAFIDELDPKEAEKRAPRDESGDGFYAMRDERTGKWVPRYDRLIEGEGRRFAPEDRAGELSVLAVDWFDAVAFIRWRANKLGRPGVARLPTELEYEKAARGVDGRCHPWGDRFDPTFCKMRESRPGFPQPELRGAFRVDESLYGVRDLAGGMREWVADISIDGVDHELTVEGALAEPEPARGAPRDQAGMRVARGGAWCDPAINTRAASRVRYFTIFRTTRIGFRERIALPPR